MKRNSMVEREILTYLERKVLNEIVRPALSSPKNDSLYGEKTISETLDFSDLLQGIKDFYLKNNGDISKWNYLMLEIKL